MSESELQSEIESFSSENNIYQVEEILDKRMKNKRTEYLVKWQNYPFEQCTWEPIKNLRQVLSMIVDFDKNMKQQKQYQENDDGNYGLNDSAEEIIDIRRNNGIQYQIKWKKRNNDIRNNQSWISQEQLKIHNPELLIEFLMQRIKWPQK